MIGRWVILLAVAIVLSLVVGQIAGWAGASQTMRSFLTGLTGVFCGMYGPKVLRFSWNDPV